MTQTALEVEHNLKTALLKDDVLHTIETLLDLTQVLVKRGQLVDGPSADNVSSIIVDSQVGEVTIELDWKNSSQIRREWFFKILHSRGLIEVDIEADFKSKVILKSDRWKMLA